MATGRLEQDALSTLLSVDDHASSHDDDAPSPRVANAAVGMHSKLRPWAARTAEANATAKIRASNLTQVAAQCVCLCMSVCLFVCDTVVADE